MNKRNLAVMASCMLLYTSFAYVAHAEEEGTAADQAKQEETTQLDEVVVTDTMLNPLKIPVKMTTITAEQIKAKGAQTVAEAVKDVAGLSVTGNNVKGKKFGQIRGSDANSTKVIIDGVMLSSVGDGRTDLSMIPTDNIEKIEIIKGPVPVMYGTNAPGGVIFITTKNSGGKQSGALTIARGSWDTNIYALSLSGKADKVSYYFGGKRTDTDGYNDNPQNVINPVTHTVYSRHTAEDSEYFNGKLKWDINAKSSLTVFGSYSDSTKELANRYGLNPATNRVELLGYPSQGGALTQLNRYFGGGPNPGQTYDWEYDPYKQSYIGAVYNQKLSKDSDLSLKAYHSGQTSFLKTSPGAQSVDWDGAINGYELQHTIRTSRINTATWGYTYEIRNFTEITADVLSNTTVGTGTYSRADYDYTGRSYYIQDVTNINRKLSTSFGYRHNETTDNIILHVNNTNNWQNQYGTYSSDDPVFTMNYKLSENTFVHGSIGKSFRSPNAIERSAPNSNTVPVLPEEAINREVGLSVAKSGLDFDVTYFSRDITNMIKSIAGIGQRNTYFNIPNVEMHGYEAEVSKKFNKHLKGFWNFSYTNAYDISKQSQVADVPYRKYSYGFNYAGTGGINASLAVNYVGAVRSMFSQGNGNNNGDGNGGDWKTHGVPGYHVVDLMINKGDDNKEYYLKVLNLFDKEYCTGSYMFAPGRYVEVGTTIKF